VQVDTTAALATLNEVLPDMALVESATLHISIHGCSSREYGDAFTQDMAALAQLPRLSALHLCEFSSCLAADGARACRAHLAGMAGLTSLQVHVPRWSRSSPWLVGERVVASGQECGITVKAIAPAIAGLPRLRELRLSDSGIDECAARALAAAVEQMQSITCLSLANNELGDRGAKAVALGIAPLASDLQELDLSGRLIGRTGAGALALPCMCLPALHTLDLSKNRCAGPGLAVGQVCRALTRLVLSGRGDTVRREFRELEQSPPFAVLRASTRGAWFSRLHELRMRGASDASMRFALELARTGPMAQLHSLTLDA
jgi:Leucine Rich repeat